MSINKITDCHPGLYDKIVEYEPSHNNFKINAQIETQETLTADECKLAFKEPVVVKSIFEEKAWQDFSDIWTTGRTFDLENSFRQIPFPLSNKKITLAYTSFLKDENGKEKVVNFTKGKLNINIPNIIKRICLYKVTTDQGLRYTAYVETLPVETSVVDDQLEESSLKSNSCLIKIPQSYEEPQVANSSTLFSKNYGQQDFDYIRQELKIAQDKTITGTVYFTKTFTLPEGFSPVTEFDTGGNIEEIYYYFDYSNSPFEVSPQESGRESQYNLQGDKLVANTKGYSFSFEGQYSDNIDALLSSKVYYWQFSHLLYSKNDWQPFYLIRKRQIKNLKARESIPINYTVNKKLIKWDIDRNKNNFNYDNFLMGQSVTCRGYKIKDASLRSFDSFEDIGTSNDVIYTPINQYLFSQDSEYVDFMRIVEPMTGFKYQNDDGTTALSFSDSENICCKYLHVDNYSGDLKHFNFLFNYPSGALPGTIVKIFSNKGNFLTDWTANATFTPLNNYQMLYNSYYHFLQNVEPLYQTDKGYVYVSTDDKHVLCYEGEDTHIDVPIINSITGNFTKYNQASSFSLKFPKDTLGGAPGCFADSRITSIQCYSIEDWLKFDNKKFNQYYHLGAGLFNVGDYEENIGYSLIIGDNELTTLHIYNDLPENAFYGCNSIKNIYIHKTGLALAANSLQLTTTEKVQVYYNGEREDLVSAFGTFTNYELHKMTVLEQPNFEKTFSFAIENDTSLDPMQYWYYTIENNISEDKNNPNWIELYKSDLLYTNIMQFSYRYFLPNEDYRITAYARFKSGIDKNLPVIENRTIEGKPISITLPQETDVSNQLIEEIGAGALFPSQVLFPSQDLYPGLSDKFNSYKNVVILRQDKDTGRSVIIFKGSGANIPGLRDYSILNNKTYQYWFYCFNTLKDNSIALQTYKSNYIKTHFDEWVLMEVEESRDSNNNIQEGIYKCRNQYAFAININSGTINNGNAPSISIAAGRNPTIQMDTSNYWQGTLSALLGVMSSTIRYEQTVIMEEEFRNLSNSSYKKFLKDKDGHMWEVELSAAPTLEAKENVWVNGVYKTLRSKQLNWVQTGNADHISIINK